MNERDGALWLDDEKAPGPYQKPIRVSVTIAGANCPICKESYRVSAETRQKYGFPAVGHPRPFTFGERVKRRDF